MDEIRGQSFTPGLPPDPQVQWEKLQRSGLLPSVSSFAIYRRHILRRLADVQAHIEERPIAVGSAKDVKAIHLTIFQDVHPWAGQIRGPGQTVRFGQNEGAHPDRLPRELAMWEAQTKDLLDNAKTTMEKLAAIAFSHARFERIHPFRDGNGRTGRAIMNHQLTAAFGYKDRSRLDRIEYIDSLKQASHGNLTALVHVLAQREGISIPENELFLSPYRLAPLVDDQRALSTLKQELDASKMSQSAMNIMLKMEIVSAKKLKTNEPGKSKRPPGRSKGFK